MLLRFPARVQLFAARPDNTLCRMQDRFIESNEVLQVDEPVLHTTAGGHPRLAVPVLNKEGSSRFLVEDLSEEIKCLCVTWESEVRLLRLVSRGQFVRITKDGSPPEKIRQDILAAMRRLPPVITRLLKPMSCMRLYTSCVGGIRPTGEELPIGTSFLVEEPFEETILFGDDGHTWPVFAFPVWYLDERRFLILAELSPGAAIAQAKLYAARCVTHASPGTFKQARLEEARADAEQALKSLWSEFRIYARPNLQPVGG